MVTLSIQDCPNDLLIIKRMKKSLQNNFKLTKGRDVDKAVMLANYLRCLGDYEEAAALLDSFIYEISHNPDREDLWESVGQGIILRANIASILHGADLRKNLVSRINENDILTTDYKRYDLFLMVKEDHSYNLQRGIEETHKYKCAIWGQEALSFLYFFEMLPYYKDETPDGFEEELFVLIKKCYSELNALLLQKQGKPKS